MEDDSCAVLKRSSHSCGTGRPGALRSNGWHSPAERGSVVFMFLFITFARMISVLAFSRFQYAERCRVHFRTRKLGAVRQGVVPAARWTRHPEEPAGPTTVTVAQP